jgi:hypothetical protein
MTSVLAPVKNITLQGIAPDVIQSCVLAPAVPAPTPEPGDVIYAPVAPGITYGSLPVITTGTTPGNLVIVDTSPDQIIGCANDVGTDPQSRLNALFPSAVDGDGAVDRATNNIWVYDGATWNNVGPTPGPTLTVNSTIPPWNEIVVYDARVRTRLEVNGLAYALELLTEPDAYGITLGLGVRSISIQVEVPAATVALGAPTPLVSGGASVSVPVLNVNTAPVMPSVSSGVSVAVPTTNIDLNAFAPPYVGTTATVIQPPVENQGFAALVPHVASGASVIPPASASTLAAFVPDVNVRWGGDIITFSITPTGTVASPVNNYYKRYVFTCTYSAAEMATACDGAASAEIRGMRMYVITQPTYQPFTGYTVAAKNTTNAITANNSGTNGGTFTTVRGSTTQSFVAGQYVELLFGTPISWTGDNFVFAWSWCATTDFSSAGTVNSGTGTSWFTGSDNSGCFAVTASAGSSVAVRPVLQLLYKA